MNCRRANSLLGNSLLSQQHSSAAEAEIHLADFTARLEAAPFQTCLETWSMTEAAGPQAMATIALEAPEGSAADKIIMLARFAGGGEWEIRFA